MTLCIVKTLTRGDMQVRLLCEARRLSGSAWGRRALCGVAAGARTACHRLMGPHSQLLGPPNTPGILPFHEHDIHLGSWHLKPSSPLQLHHSFMHFIGRAALPAEAIR